MINKIKDIVKNVEQSYRFNRVTKAFERRYLNVNPDLFKETIDGDLIKQYEMKWSVFGKKVETKTFRLCYNLSGIADLNIVPENLFASVIEPRLNRYAISNFLEIKNVYNKWFRSSEHFPKAFFHKIDGIYYNNDYQIINDIDHYLSQNRLELPVIIKASKDTYGGTDVRFIKRPEDVKIALSEFKNLVCQEVIKQSKFLEDINSSSINTIRTCLYRNDQGSFEVLNNSIRFGVNGSLDNETSGGIVCNINENGMLHTYAVDKYANKFVEHPNTCAKFLSLKIPFYDELNQVAIKIANELIYCNLASLDMCLDMNNNWRCIEVNLRGQTIRFAQYAGKGFFGKHTDDVIKKVRDI
ncbi:sugar-transfer associated ATP-grasp domain-containing protein [Sphingobacterium suaedae]|uniref:Sugar-transfer associated ATP-grasp domain-containing protein n=1 Tax=Sphingobacterium suaedae TaxID=1686402 RepID=A0ABW5KKA8_9SPHI